MRFELSVTIARPPAAVFAFLRDKDRYPQPPGSPVLVLDKTTPGPVGVGTRYREVVRMFPFIRGEIRSEITVYEPDHILGERFEGAGMLGYLAYELTESDGGTLLVQRETLHLTGPLKIIAPLWRRMLAPRLRERLQSIKHDLEAHTPRPGADGEPEENA